MFFKSVGLTSSLDYVICHFRRRQRHRQKNYVRNIVSSFRLDEFKTFFRLSRVSVQCLQEKICEICLLENVSGIVSREAAGGTIQTPFGDRMLMLLWYMASLDRISSIADRFGVSESTASYSIRNLLRFFHDYLVDRMIVWPNAAELVEMQEMYEDLKNFPGVCGMIDGTHIPIRKPSVRGTDYYNRKDYYSVILQGVVVEDMRFTNVYAGFPGKVHDARVFRHSPLFNMGQNFCGNGHLLGDSAYPNIGWLLTPFRDNGNLTENQRRYNVTHSSIRSTVERAFGLLKGRFTRLQYIDQRNLFTIVYTIITACVLHNICIINSDDFANYLQDDPMPQLGPNANVADANALNVGAIKRLQIARRL